MNLYDFLDLFLRLLELGHWHRGKIIPLSKISSQELILIRVLQSTYLDFRQALRGQGRRLSERMRFADYATWQQCQYYNFTAYPQRYPQEFSLASWTSANRVARQALQTIRLKYHLERI